MKSNERKCKWEKWHDPLNSDTTDVELPEGTNEDNIEYYDFSGGSDAVALKNIDEEFLENLKRKIHGIKPLRVLNTKLGLLTVTENAIAGSHFDFWTLHTNFPITDEIGKIICDCPGVDAFMPLTRYRCRIGFPSSGLFNVTEVKLAIQKKICEVSVHQIDDNLINPSFTEEVQIQIEKKIDELKSRSRYWALYVLPNGTMEMLEADASNDIFNSKLKILEESQKLIGGKVFIS